MGLHETFQAVPHYLATIDADAYLELIAAIQAEHGPLSLSGLREPDGPEDWLEHLEGFHRAVAFLSHCQVRQSKGPRWPTSYTLKHMAEVKLPHTYVSNGVMIAAAIALGFPIIKHRDKFGVGQNADVGLAVPKELRGLEPGPWPAGTPGARQSYRTAQPRAAASCEKTALPGSGPKHP